MTVDLQLYIYDIANNSRQKVYATTKFRETKTKNKYI